MCVWVCINVGLSLSLGLAGIYIVGCSYASKHVSMISSDATVWKHNNVKAEF